MPTATRARSDVEPALRLLSPIYVAPDQQRAGAGHLPDRSGGRIDCSMCPKFCITEDTPQFAAEQGMDTVEAVEAGMRETAGAFREKGGEIYVPEEI